MSSVDTHTEEGIVKKAGAWYTYDGDQLGQGREKAKEFLRDNPEIAVQLHDQVLRAVGGIVDETDADAATDEVSSGVVGEETDMPTEGSD